MGLVSPEDRTSKAIQDPYNPRENTIRGADVRDDTTTAMVLSFYRIPTFSFKVGLD